MKLCVDCNFYIKDGVPMYCGKGYWESVEPSKTRTFNPIMFECIDFESDNICPGFGNDILFGLMQ